MENTSIHANHRQRLKSKFLLSGFESFENHEILELALFYAVPRKNTNEIAHKLLDHFGSIHNVFEAPSSSLTKIKGVGKEVACFFKLIIELTCSYLESKSKETCKFRTRYELCDYLTLKFIGKTEEANAIILLNSKGKIVYEGIISKGNHNSVEIHTRHLIELITIHHATAIVFAHNHPSNVAIPSKQDIITTKKLNRLFVDLNVNFIDHIIVANDDYVSLRDSNIDGLFDIDTRI